jgi:hypothetical protein
MRATARLSLLAPAINAPQKKKKKEKENQQRKAFHSHCTLLY